MKNIDEKLFCYIKQRYEKAKEDRRKYSENDEDMSLRIYFIGKENAFEEVLELIHEK